MGLVVIKRLRNAHPNLHKQGAMEACSPHLRRLVKTSEERRESEYDNVVAPLIAPTIRARLVQYVTRDPLGIGSVDWGLGLA